MGSLFNMSIEQIRKHCAEPPTLVAAPMLRPIFNGPQMVGFEPGKFDEDHQEAEEIPVAE
jgi:hypothetical protein